MPDAEVEAFYAKHCAAGGVVLAEVYSNGDRAHVGIFRSLKTAHDWIERVDENDGAVISPFVLDEPDFGNVPPEAQH